uniref:Uncharacterized protein n=1 Tax=Romanomermis culicivorax TaxID=13658 RepID=A0A915ICD3_ROMCU
MLDFERCGHIHPSVRQKKIPFDVWMDMYLVGCLFESLGKKWDVCGLLTIGRRIKDHGQTHDPTLDFVNIRMYLSEIL